MTTMRQHKRRQTARVLAHALIWKPDRFDVDYGEYDDEYDDRDDYDCTHCGGEGYAEVDDPLWDDCDEFGYGPCKSCRGTGERRHQWVF